MKRKVIDLSPCELASLACSLSIFLSENYDCEDIKKIKGLLSLICSNLSLLEQKNSK